MKKLGLSLVALCFFTSLHAGWTLWQPTDFKDNGGGSYSVTCLNYAIASCASSSGSSNQPTPGDLVLVRDEFGYIGEFEIVSIESEGRVYDNPPELPQDGASWQFQVELQD